MSIPQTRETLSADGLIRIVTKGFHRVVDHRQRPQIPLGDVLGAAFAMFSLKDPSLLAFDQRRPDTNLRNLYCLGQVPSDTAMREILDPVDPESLRPVFLDLFRALQRGKGLEPFVTLDGFYLLALDGTGYFSSTKVHCTSCLEKVNKSTGEVSYSHQMLGAAIVHPDRREVIPLAPEPICNADGASKNDCERNASKRLLAKIRAEHPKLRFLVIEDGLASNGPHIEEILSHGMHFLLGAKPGDHAHLFDQVVRGIDDDRATCITGTTVPGRRFEVMYVNGVELNSTYSHLLVNFLQYIEFDADGQVALQFTWVTNVRITRNNALALCHAGRSRWKIENETFNTLKNQGYNLDHNYGHGRQHLSVVLAMLMMLAFLVDQVQQLCCPLFQATWKKYGSKRALWEKQRSHIQHFLFTSMRQLYEIMLTDGAKEVPLPILNSG